MKEGSRTGRDIFWQKSENETMIHVLCHQSPFEFDTSDHMVEFFAILILYCTGLGYSCFLVGRGLPHPQKSLVRKIPIQTPSAKVMPLVRHTVTKASEFYLVVFIYTHHQTKMISGAFVWRYSHNLCLLNQIRKRRVNMYRACWHCEAYEEIHK